jgi:hypothetical protein
MTSRTQTEEYLRKTQLPEATESYTVIPHGTVIDTVRAMLEQYGFIITNELYKAESNGEVALGFMQIETLNDPDMAMTFNWTNSYNKVLRFSCSVGGFIYDNQVPFVSTNNQAYWNRKHTGTALEETIETIELMAASAESHFAQITAMKNKFKSLEVNRKMYAKLLGLLYFDKQIISSEQVNLIKREYDKPSFDYADKGTLWELYKMIMFGVSDQSPKSWYKQQMDINSYIQVLYNIAKIELPNEVDDSEPSYTNEEIVETIDLLLNAHDDTSENDDTSNDDTSIQDDDTSLENGFITDEEEDEVMDKLFTPILPCKGHEIESEKDEIKSLDNLIAAQNLMIEPKPFNGPAPSLFDDVDSKKERLEEIREELDNESISYGELVELQELTEFIDENDVQLLEAAGVPEFKEEPRIDLSDLEGEYSIDQMDTVIETIEERIEEAKSTMSEEEIEMVKEEHGIVDKVKEPIAPTDEDVESLFDMMDEYDEPEGNEIPWFTDENANQKIDLAPSLIPDSMREAVDDILTDKYKNKRTVVNTIEDVDHVVFELDSSEFFVIDK